MNIRHIISMLFLSALMIGCGKAEQPTDANTFDKVFGTWETIAYCTSDGYFVPSTIKETFIFKDDITFTHDNDGSISFGEYGFNPETNVISCKESRGWDMLITVTFEDDEKAVFDIKGKTAASSYKIRAQHTPQGWQK